MHVHCNKNVSCISPPIASHWFPYIRKRIQVVDQELMELSPIQVANEAMCRPIRNLTQMKGFDITTHVLACFGGAGGQHACKMAQASFGPLWFPAEM